MGSLIDGRHPEREAALLVLDNFERVIEATQMVSDLLARAPGILVLATSRTPLHAYGARVPARRPCPYRTRASAVGRAAESVRGRAVFIERAGRQPDFA